MAHAGKSGRRVVSAFIATAFAQETPDAAKGQWRKVADQLRPSVPKLGKLMDTAEADVLAYMSFPPQHRVKLHSTNPLERLNGEIKRASMWSGLRARARRSPTGTPSPVWSVPSDSNRTTSGPSSAPAT